METRIAVLKRAYALVLAGVLLVVGATAAYGAIPGANGTISACYDKQSGQVRIYDATTNQPKACGPKEIPISWNAAGQAGEDGLDGADGADGADGQDGVSGYETVVEVSDENSTYDKTVFAMCPSGKKALGGGAGVYGHFDGNSQVIIFGVALVQNNPFNENGWAARATEFTPTDDDWYLHVRVICADV